MQTSTRKNAATLESAGVYRIDVEGDLLSSHQIWMSGVTLSPNGRQDNTTRLVGTLADQAALSGVLNALYELHLPTPVAGEKNRSCRKKLNQTR